MRTRQPVAATLAGVLVILGALPGLLMTLPMADVLGRVIRFIAGESASRLPLGLLLVVAASIPLLQVFGGVFLLCRVGRRLLVGSAVPSVGVVVWLLVNAPRMTGTGCALLIPAVPVVASLLALTPSVGRWLRAARRGPQVAAQS